MPKLVLSYTCVVMFLVKQEDLLIMCTGVRFGRQTPSFCPFWILFCAKQGQRCFSGSILQLLVLRGTDVASVMVASYFQHPDNLCSYGIFSWNLFSSRGLWGGNSLVAHFYPGLYFWRPSSELAPVPSQCFYKNLTYI